VKKTRPSEKPTTYFEQVRLTAVHRAVPGLAAREAVAKTVEPAGGRRPSTVRPRARRPG
jgi:hypothetical protein